MKFLSKHIQIRDKLYLKDYLRIMELSEYVSKISHKWEHIKAENETIKILTYVEKPNWKHRKKLKDILIAAGMGSNNSKVSVKDSKELLENGIIAMSGKTAWTPRQIETDFTGHQFIETSKEIKKNEILKYLNLIHVQHNTDFHKTLNKELKELDIEKKRKKKPAVKNQVFYVEDIFKPKPLV